MNSTLAMSQIEMLGFCKESTSNEIRAVSLSSDTSILERIDPEVIGTSANHVGDIDKEYNSTFNYESGSFLSFSKSSPVEVFYFDGNTEKVSASNISQNVQAPQFLDDKWYALIKESRGNVLNLVSYDPGINSVSIECGNIGVASDNSFSSVVVDDNIIFLGNEGNIWVVSPKCQVVNRSLGRPSDPTVTWSDFKGIEVDDDRIYFLVTETTRQGASLQLMEATYDKVRSTFGTPKLIQVISRLDWINRPFSVIYDCLVRKYFIVRSTNPGTEIIQVDVSTGNIHQSVRDLKNAYFGLVSFSATVCKKLRFFVTPIENSSDKCCYNFGFTNNGINNLIGMQAIIFTPGWQFSNVTNNVSSEFDLNFVSGTNNFNLEHNNGFIQNQSYFGGTFCLDSNISNPPSPQVVHFEWWYRHPVTGGVSRVCPQRFELECSPRPSNPCENLRASAIEVSNCVNPDLINNIPCPQIYAPVCGCNGVTYSNDCTAINQHGVTVFTPGECNGRNAPSVPQGCCHSVTLHHGNLDNIESVNVNLLTNGWTFGQLVTYNPLVINSVAPTNFSIDDPNNQFLPSGSNSAFYFCLTGDDPNLDVPQLIEIEWVLYDESDNSYTKCRDTIKVNCEPPVNSDCLTIDSFKVECLDSLRYSVCFQVNNDADFAFGNFFALVSPNPPFYINNVNNVIQVIPGPLAPGSSQQFCLNIVLDSPLTSSQIMTLDLNGLSVNNDSCCHTQVEIPMAPCCVPCEDKSITFTEYDLEDDQCCFAVNIESNCADDFFTHLDFQILTPGVLFGGHVMDSVYSNDFSVSSAPTNIVVAHNSGNLPIGTYENLMIFCLDNINEPSQDYPSIVVNWYAVIDTQATIACADTLVTECVSVTDNDCLDITDQSLICVDGQLCYSFTVTNLSNPPLQAGFIVLSDENTNTTINPIPITPSLSINESTTITYCFPVDPDYPYAYYAFSYRLMSEGLTDCCYENNIVDTIPIPNCQSCCENEREFFEIINDPNTWNLSIDERNCTVTLDVQGFNDCHQMINLQPSWGDNSNVNPAFTGANGTWTHTYSQSGTYEICIIYVEIENGGICWEGEICRPVNINCCPEPSEVSIADTLVCVNNAGNIFIPLECNDVCNITSVQWFIKPASESNWPLQPVQVTSGCIGLTISALQYASGQILDVYASITYDQNSCCEGNADTTNVAQIEICKPIACQFSYGNQVFAFCGTGEVQPIVANIENLCTDHTYSWTYDSPNGPIVYPNTNVLPEHTIEYDNTSNPCFRNHTFRFSIEGSCPQACAISFTTYNPDAPKGSLIMDPFESQPFCPGEDATLRYTEACTATWSWFSTTVDPPADITDYTPILGVGNSNSLINTNQLYQTTWFMVQRPNGPCADTVQYRIEVKDSISIQDFTTDTNDCSEDFVDMTLNFGPSPMVNGQINWMLNGDVIGSEAVGNSPALYNHLSTGDVSGVYYAELIDLDCNTSLASNISIIEPSCTPIILGPCYRCCSDKDKPIILEGQLVVPPNKSCPNESDCTYQWYKLEQGIMTPLATGNILESIVADTFVLETNCNGCIKLSKPHIVVDCCGPVSTKDDIAIQNIYIYPNPAKDIINIVINPMPVNALEIQVTDINGRLVKRINNITTDYSNIDVGQLQSGFYLVNFYSQGQKIWVDKIIIQK